MPELPEVEINARNLRRWTAGRRLVRVRATKSRVLRPPTPAVFARGLEDRAFTAIDRRGKHLLITLGAPPAGGEPVGLYSHLGMTGKWVRRAPGEPPPAHARASLELDDKSWLHYQDMRLFGRLWRVPGARFDTVPELARLGPDPLLDGVDPEALAARLGRTGRSLHTTLLDQRVLAGIGNIQASESLFRARLHPLTPARALGAAEVKRLAEGILASIAETLAREEGPEITYVEEPGAENPFAIYGREGEPCPRCQTPIARVVVGARSAYFCPRCQPPPKSRPSPP